MAVRDVERGEAAAGAHPRSVDHPVQLEVRELDLASLDSVRAFADRLPRRARPPRPAHQQRRADGLPARDDQGRLRAAVRHEPPRPLPPRHAAHAGARRRGSVPTRLAQLARTRLRPTSTSTTTGSSARPTTPWVAYGRSKTANALFAVAFDRRHAADGVHAYSVHPGGIHTELGAPPHGRDPRCAAPSPGVERPSVPVEDDPAGRGDVGVGGDGRRARRLRRRTTSRTAASPRSPTRPCWKRACVRMPRTLDRAEALWELSERLVAR